MNFKLALGCENTYERSTPFCFAEKGAANFNYNNDGLIRLLGFPFQPPMPPQTHVWIGLTQRLPQAVIFYSDNTTWIYGYGRPANSVYSPFLTLVTVVSILLLL